MSSADVEMQMGLPLGTGTYKDAYTVVETTNPGNPANFKVPAGTDLQKICMVKYKTPFRIEDFRVSNKEKHKPFIQKMISDKDFKFYMDFYLGLDRKNPDDKQYMDYLNSNHLPVLTKIEDANQTILNNKKFDDDFNVYADNKKLINCINELAKMHELGIASLSPKIHKIRIVLGKSTTINRNPNFTPMYYGIPFVPSSETSEINGKIQELINANEKSFEDNTITHFQILYLIEKCDDDIIKHYYGITDSSTRRQFLEDMGNAINEFVEKFVDETGELNGDFKLANLCPNYSNGNITVNNLDSDPQYFIANTDKDPNFNKHAKTFMKFCAFAMVDKHKPDVKFPDWFVTQQEVDDMIVFFHDIKYLKYEFNPINMLYFYLVSRHDFFNFTKLLYYYNPLIPDKMLSLKKKFIVPPDVEHKELLPIPFIGTDGSFPTIGNKGGKKTRRKRHHKKKRRTRKNK